MLNYEFHLPGAYTKDMVSIELQKEGSTQFLVFKSELMKCLFNSDHFDNHIGQEIKNDVNKNACALARKHAVNDFRRQHEKKEGRKKIIPSEMKYPLPFFVKTSTLHHLGERNTRELAYSGDTCLLLIKARRGRNSLRFTLKERYGGSLVHIIGVASVLNVTLVTEKKNFKSKSQTPQKYSSAVLYANDSDEDSDDDNEQNRSHVNQQENLSDMSYSNSVNGVSL